MLHYILVEGPEGRPSIVQEEAHAFGLATAALIKQARCVGPLLAGRRLPAAAPRH